MGKERIAVLFLAAVIGASCADSGPTELTSPAETQAVKPDRADNVGGDVIGTLTGGTFRGVVKVTEFGLDAERNLTVKGVLNGVATIGGVATEIVDQAFSTTAELTSGGESTGSMEGMVSGGHDDMINARCQVLFLDLGPIFLNLLGLELNLSQIILDLDAVSGAGNLLGNLLCAVVGLLDGFNLSGLLNLLDLINNLLG
jgi:hypothetical protein